VSDESIDGLVEYDEQRHGWVEHADPNMPGGEGREDNFIPDADGGTDANTDPWVPGLEPADPGASDPGASDGGGGSDMGELEKLLAESEGHHFAPWDVEPIDAGPDNQAID
jgi:hypothetical protein